MELNDYKIIKLEDRPKVRCHHEIFAKEHVGVGSEKDTLKPKGRTLFLLNIPPYIDEKCLEFAFKDIGEIERIIFEYKNNKDESSESIAHDAFSHLRPLYKFKFAYVVFKQTKCVQQALQLEHLIVHDGKKTIIESGLQKWKQLYWESIPNEDELQEEIDAYMKLHDEKERILSQKEKAGEEDDEGWTVVTKRGKNAGFEQTASFINRLEEKSKKSRELKNFYTFQIRESKFRNIVSLRRKFEEDKRKIETMKKSKRFNPFK